MSRVAALIKVLRERGVDADSILAAVEALEGASDTAAEKRRAWDRERQAKRRAAALASSGSPVENPVDCPPDGSPLRDNNQPPSQPQNASRSSVGALAPKRSKARQQLGADWSPDEAGIAFAKRSGLSDADQRRELAKFKDHHRGRGNLMADWDAAWRTWCRRSQEFTAGRIRHDVPKPTVHDAAAALDVWARGELDRETRAGGGARPPDVRLLSSR